MSDISKKDTSQSKEDAAYEAMMAKLDAPIVEVDMTVVRIIEKLNTPIPIKSKIDPIVDKLNATIVTPSTNTKPEPNEHQSAEDLMVILGITK